MALRISSAQHWKEYGIPSVLVQSCAQVRRRLQVGADEFHPRPKVDSLLIEIRFDSAKSSADDFEMLRHTVRAAFSSRRKTLVNNLTASLPAEFFGSMGKSQKRALILEALEASNLRPDIRAEDAAVEEFGRLAARISKIS